MLKMIVLWVLMMAISPWVSAEDTKDLFAASAAGKPERVEALLAQGIDVNGKIDQDRTALMAASFNGNWRVVKLLLAYGAAVNLVDKTGATALSDAVLFGSIETVSALLAAGANVDVADAQGVKLIVKAKKQNREAIVKLLETAATKAETKADEAAEGAKPEEARK